jgi:hypothetical protein
MQQKIVACDAAASYSAHFKRTRAQSSYFCFQIASGEVTR